MKTSNQLETRILNVLTELQSENLCHMARIYLTVELQVLKDILQSGDKLTPQEKQSYIQDIVCQEFNTTFTEMINKKKVRKREFLIPRQLINYFKKRYLKQSYKEIASCFGKNHATVLSNIKTVQNCIDTDKNFKQVIERIDKKIINCIGEN